jgi:predicted permease
MNGIWQDLRFGARRLFASPGFTLLASLMLALGIGANTAFFSLVDAVLLRPFPVANQDELVAVKSISEDRPDVDTLSMPDYRDFRDEQQVFAALVAYSLNDFSVTAGEKTERLFGGMVSANYFDTLGLRMPLGRGFLPEENLASARPVAVISFDLWQRSYGRSPDILGKPLKVNGMDFAIVGVAPQGFRGLTLGYRPDLWTPLAKMAEVLPAWWRDMDLIERRDVRTLDVLGRLRSGVSLEQAQVEMTSLARQLEQAFPDTNRGWSVRMELLGEERLPPSERGAVVSVVAILVAVAVLILLIAGANVANLVLVRVSGRRSEIAVRFALGSSRMQVIREVLTENLILYALGFLVSLAVAFWTLDILHALPLFSQGELTFDLGLDTRVLAFGTALALAAGMVSGLGPAFRASRSDPRTALYGNPTGSRSYGSRFRNLLVVAQVALSLILLVGAALFARTLQSLYAIDPGYRTENVLDLSVDFNTMDKTYDESRGMAFYRQALERVRALPGVRSATWAGDVPLRRRRLLVWFFPREETPQKEEDWLQIDCNVVGPDYVRTLGIPLVSGRDFSDRDSADSQEVAIVNQSMARRYWPGVDPVGKRIKVRGRTGIKSIEVIGVVGDVRQRALWDEPQPYIYLALYQRYFPEMTLQAHVAGDTQTLTPQIKGVIEALDKDLPVFNVMLLDEQLALALSHQRVGAALLGASGLLALVLAAIGIFAVTQFSVTQRTREIGLRMALGAEARDVTRLIVRQGTLAAAIGLAVGATASIALGRFIENLLFGVRTTDPVSLAGSMVLLAGAALLATLIPAYRAARQDPAASLRHE